MPPWDCDPLFREMILDLARKHQPVAAAVAVDWIQENTANWLDEVLHWYAGDYPRWSSPLCNPMNNVTAEAMEWAKCIVLIEYLALTEPKNKLQSDGRPHWIDRNRWEEVRRIASYNFPARMHVKRDILKLFPDVSCWLKFNSRICEIRHKVRPLEESGNDFECVSATAFLEHRSIPIIPVFNEDGTIGTSIKWTQVDEETLFERQKCSARHFVVEMLLPAPLWIGENEYGNDSSGGWHHYIHATLT